MKVGLMVITEDALPSSKLGAKRANQDRLHQKSSLKTVETSEHSNPYRSLVGFVRVLAGERQTIKEVSLHYYLGWNLNCPELVAHAPSTQIPPTLQQLHKNNRKDSLLLGAYYTILFKSFFFFFFDFYLDSY